MNYIVLDLEWNQSPFGKNFTNKKIPFEIIEIGAVKLNSNMKEIGRFSELVKPRVYKNLNRITGNLVHLTTDELKDARPFDQVIKSFLDFCGNDFVFCTWGCLDLLELQRNMKYYHIKPLSNGPIAFLDIQKLFALQFEGRKRQHTLEYAVDFCKIKKDIPFHRAFADAYYTSKVMRYIKRDVRKKYSFDTYCIPKSKEDEIHIFFRDYYKYISKGYATKLELLNDNDVAFDECYLCKRRVLHLIPWFSTNSKHYYSVSKCKRHGYIKGKIRVRKAEDGKLFVIKTMKQIREDAYAEIAEKYEKTKNQVKDE